MAGMNCVVVTPETTALDEKVDMVVVPLFDGEIGIASNHSPMIGRLGFGEMRLIRGGTSERYYVDGGFVQVQDNVVSVLTNRMLPESEVDRHEAQALLEDALAAQAHTVATMEIRDRKIKQARGMMRITDKV